jgi:putative ABC transport system permease protein
MSLWRIAWRSIQQRGLASSLTSFSMALGVMLVVCVLSIHGIIAQSFRNNANLGYNIIVGAKGGALQLTLNSVFHLSAPIENVPYDYYLEFLDAERRDAEYRNSIQWQTHEALRNAGSTLTASLAVDGVSKLGAMLAQDAVLEQYARTGSHAQFIRDANRAVTPLTPGRSGRFGAFTELAIPMCLGDYFGRFRSVGTTVEFFDKLTFGEDGSRAYEFAEGRNFQHHSEEYGYFEAVLGATVAKEMELQLGDKISPTHGDPERGGSPHALGFYVVGILKPSGTPNDRAVFVNIEGFYLMEGHARPIAASDDQLVAGRSPPRAADSADLPLPVEQREVTAILVRTSSPLVASGVQNTINEGQIAQAVLPVLEIYRLFDAFVKPIQRVLLALTVIVCVVSGVSILVSIYNSMSDRRHEIAVMRALGAGRNTVMTVILLESIVLSLTGGAVGWTLGHGLNWLAAPQIEQQTGVAIGFWDFAPPVNIVEFLGANSALPILSEVRISSELFLIPGLILLAVIVGFVPALSAYRTDVAKSLER